MNTLTSQEILKRIRDAGVVGAGGGGFPTHVKLQAKVEVVIANGAECEPLARVDQQQMAAQPRKVLRGLQLAMQATGAAQGVVALKAKYHDAEDRLNEAIARAGLKDAIRLHLLNDFYPAGDEFVLVHEVLGRAIPEFGLPRDVGAVVSNVGTLIDVADAADELKPVTHRWVTVAGEVRKPASFRVPIGTPLSLLVQAAGGSRINNPRFILGGPMMGALVPGPDRPVTKTDSLVLVLHEDHQVVQRRTRDFARRLHHTRASCLKCMMCSEICPRFLLGHRLFPDRLMRNVAAGITEDVEAFSGAALCSECGLCTVYACVVNLDPCYMNREFKRRLQAAGVPRLTPQPASTPHRFAPLRRVPGRRLIARLNVSAYDLPAPLADLALKAPRLVVMLKQHAGAPAVPVVQKGQKVRAGDLLADIREGALGARVHAGLAAAVSDVTPDSIILDAE